MSGRLWLKMSAAGLGLSIGGPALVYYLTPSEEELFKRYNPDLQRRSLQNREKTQRDFDGFVNHLKDYSKSDKPIWEAASEAEAAAKSETIRQRESSKAAELQRREAINLEANK